MTTEQKVKQTVINTSRTICNEVGEQLNMRFDQDALDLIAEMTYKKLCQYGPDLEAFQKHAKRTQMNVDDVKLLVRNNPGLVELVNKRAQFLSDNRPTEAPTTNKRKRKAAGSTS